MIRIPQTSMSPRVLPMNTPITHPGMTYGDFVRAENIAKKRKTKGLPPSPIKNQTEKGMTPNMVIVLGHIAAQDGGINQSALAVLMDTTRSSIQNYCRALVKCGAILNLSTRSNKAIYVVEQTTEGETKP